MFPKEFSMSTQTEATMTETTTIEPAVTETKAKTTKPSAPKAPTTAPKVMTSAQADKEATLTNKAQASDLNYSIPLASLTANQNPREEPANLAAMGYKLIDSKDVEHSLLHMCLSDNMEIVAAVVELFETHEGDVAETQTDVKADLSDVKGLKEVVQKKSIVSLAHSMTIKQVQAVSVLKGGKRKDGGNNFTLVFGQRRTAARLYSYAKSRVDKEAGIKDSVFKNVLPTITAVELKLSEEEAFELAVQENMNRKDFTPVQEARIYAAYKQRVNPSTGKKWNLKDVAQHFDLKYGHVRNRHALVIPFVPDQTDDKGNITQRGRGLTDEERAAVERGDKTLTWAIRRALREEHYSESGAPQANRRKAIPLKEIEKKFDSTSDDVADLEAVGRRKALAECMGLTLKQATKESEKRIEAEETKELEAGNKKGKKSKLGKKTDAEAETPEATKTAETAASAAE